MNALLSPPVRAFVPPLPQMRAFVITFGNRDNPRLVLDVMALSSARAFEQHAHECRDGERMDIQPGVRK